MPIGKKRLGQMMTADQRIKGKRKKEKERIEDDNDEERKRRKRRRKKTVTMIERLLTPT